MAQVWTNRNTFDLFAWLHESVSKSCGFDSQHNSRISDIRETDAEKLHVCDLIGGYDYHRLQKLQKGNRKSTGFDDTIIDSADLEAAAFLQ